MSEDLILPVNSGRKEMYTALLPQLETLLTGETDLIANLGNMAAALREAFGFLWVGFYLVRENQLVLGPFQGPVACTRIGFGKGVCGKAWETGQTQLIPDVEAFPGHIACSSASRSEIVVPLFSNGKVVAVLDVDSEKQDHFDATDQQYLEKMVRLISFPG